MEVEPPSEMLSFFDQNKTVENVQNVLVFNMRLPISKLCGFRNTKQK